MTAPGAAVSREWLDRELPDAPRSTFNPGDSSYRGESGLRSNKLARLHLNPQRTVCDPVHTSQDPDVLALRK